MPLVPKKHHYKSEADVFRQTINRIKRLGLGHDDTTWVLLQASYRKTWKRIKLMLEGYLYDALPGYDTMVTWKGKRIPHGDNVVRKIMFILQDTYNLK